MKTEDLKKHEEICRFTSRGVPKAEALVNESISTHFISLSKCTEIDVGFRYYFHLNLFDIENSR